MIQSCNAAAERLFGYSSAKLVGHPVRMLIPPDRQSEEDEILAKLRRGERVDHFETIRLAKGGRPIDISLTISPVRDETGRIVGASKIARDITLLNQAEAERVRLIEENAAVTETLNEVGAVVASDLDRETVVQAVTDAATELTTAEFGAFFYNVVDEAGESYTLYTISGVPREAFSKFPMPRNTAVFEPTFKGTGVVRSADITKDPRYGRNAPYHGMPPGHLPVRSYLAVPVKGPLGPTYRRAVLRPLRGRPLHRASRAARGGHRVVGGGGARERALVRQRAGGQPSQGRFPGQPLARTAHAAQRDPRICASCCARAWCRRTSSRRRSRPSSAMRRR